MRRTVGQALFEIGDTLPQKYTPCIALALAGLLLFELSNAPVYAQTAIPTPQELDQLLAPVALYPDALLAQITAASTNPQEILDADAWLKQNGALAGDALVNAAQQQGFDPAFIALLSFPQVLDMMAQKIDDYAAIGAAFSNTRQPLWTRFNDCGPTRMRRELSKAILRFR